MENFKLDDIHALLPKELTEQGKNRLVNALKQFTGENSDKIYTDFYTASPHEYFLQGDLVREIRFPDWNDKTAEFEKVYYDVILLSNTCDMDDNNTRDIPKKVMVAKVIKLSAFIECIDTAIVKEVDQLIKAVKSQHYTNLFYLPGEDGEEYIAYLDDVSTIYVEELAEMKNELSENRVSILGQFGYYLFILKLSFHLHRLPEQTHRSLT
ncbi:hypothetical protein [Cytophaga hutchinsonii]|uniref:Uncharacterized protein n=1 Tax=Cytophaga hutchinsonii (strain ATCC 33406 / DSM 1761 / CIP 103989 / NBRC 15051 / NCIMB 9469 / D465) TaxID=269798 RepID=A0A6N4SMM9_CYTH3|nr:hypothetical protein [Cytophaga hutchinsonii]ABG57529.1 hypothetical protein CHU_0237 [Cytophaga hutchinsonii ATCC 33406]SFW99252.1 hypothetical protein SAMN04487930_10189 [Cytophaga hutchinsonii ATCC 33406]